MTNNKTMTVFVTRIIPEEGIKLLRESGCTVNQYSGNTELTQAELIEECKRSDALLHAGTNKIDESFLNACKHLKVVSLLTVGYDLVDIPAAKKLGIPVGNTPDVLSNATADTAFLLMLAVSRKAFYLHKKITKGEWGFYEPTADLGIELNNKTLGIFGLGKIGFEFARKCKAAFNTKLIYHNRNNNPKAEAELGATKVSFDELLQQSDVLSLHCKLTAETEGLFDKKVFQKMKPTSIFINTGRGKLHNEADLITALQNNLIWGAGLDVTNPEPMDKNNPLLEMPNVAILPHIGSQTIEARSAMSRIAAQNVLAGLKGQPLPHSVT